MLTKSIALLLGLFAFCSPSLAQEQSAAEQLANARLLAHLKDNKLWQGSWAGQSGSDVCEVDVVWGDRAGLPVVQVRYAVLNGATWRGLEIEFASTDRLSSQTLNAFSTPTKEAMEKDVEADGAKTVTRLNWDRLQREETIGAVAIEVARAGEGTQQEKVHDLACNRLEKLKRDCDPSKPGCVRAFEPIGAIQPEEVKAPLAPEQMLEANEQLLLEVQRKLPTGQWDGKADEDKCSVQILWDKKDGGLAMHIHTIWNIESLPDPTVGNYDLYVTDSLSDQSEVFENQGFKRRTILQSRYVEKGKYSSRLDIETYTKTDILKAIAVYNSVNAEPEFKFYCSSLKEFEAAK